MKAIDGIIGVGWIVFWAYWLVMAFTAKAEQSRWTRFAGVRVGIVLVVVLLIRLRVFRGPGAVTESPWLLGIGLAFFVLGLVLPVWARVYLGGNWGMPMSQRADPELVTTGPFREDPPPHLQRRHPRHGRHGDSGQPLLADRGRDRRRLLPVQRRGRGTHHGQALPRCLPALQARHEDAHSLHPLTGRGVYAG